MEAAFSLGKSACHPSAVAQDDKQISPNYPITFSPYYPNHFFPQFPFPRTSTCFSLYFF
jgi:hypothetical protein